MIIDTKKIIDISMDLDDRTIVWKDDQQPRLVPVTRMPEAPVNFTWLNFGSHAGTHIDAPYHLFSEKWTSDQIPFERYFGRCQVIDLTDVKDMITAKDLRKHDINQSIVLLKTENSFDPMDKYNSKHVAIDESAAQYLIDMGVTTLGYDYQSFEREGRCDIHRMFLKRSITLIDNLRLKDVEGKTYYLLCLPLKVIGIDGAPARAVLME